LFYFLEAQLSGEHSPGWTLDKQEEEVDAKLEETIYRSSVLPARGHARRRSGAAATATTATYDGNTRLPCKHD
jgi:hypothetical protein